MATADVQAYLDVKRRISELCAELGRPEPQLIAVSKKKSIEDIEALYCQGQRDFAENYVQELIEKARLGRERSLSEIRWHFIGHLQKNKIKALLPEVETIHSVDSVELARKLNGACDKLGRPQPLSIFLQVNVDDEISKSGFDTQSAMSAALEVGRLSHLKLEGLMAIPKPGNSADAFRKMKDLSKKLGPSTCGCLSMGMSADFEEAIREGATHLRLGTVLFGERR